MVSVVSAAPRAMRSRSREFSSAIRTTTLDVALLGRRNTGQPLSSAFLSLKPWMNALITSGSIGSMAGICTERIIVDEAISAYYGVRKSADRARDGIAKTGLLCRAHASRANAVGGLVARPTADRSRRRASCLATDEPTVAPVKIIRSHAYRGGWEKEEGGRREKYARESARELTWSPAPARGGRGGDKPLTRSARRRRPRRRRPCAGVCGAPFALCFPCRSRGRRRGPCRSSPSSR